MSVSSCPGKGRNCPRSGSLRTALPGGGPTDTSYRHAGSRLPRERGLTRHIGVVSPQQSAASLLQPFREVLASPCPTFSPLWGIKRAGVTRLPPPASTVRALTLVLGF